MGLDDKIYKPAAVHHKISMAKNQLMGPNEYTANGELLQRDLREKMPEVGKIFAAYVQRCKQANAMDFDDLLTLTFQLFRDHEDIRRKYADRFDFILVDEYQDTNQVQMNIVMQLCKENQRVCAVWVMATSEIETAKEGAMAVFTAVTQGILVAGLSNYVNQIIKQIHKPE